MHAISCMALVLLDVVQTYTEVYFQGYHFVPSIVLDL